MVTPSSGAVVLVPFPFSDLSQSKRRPAIVLADAEKGDFVLCQITSKAYADARAVELTNASFASGSLRVVSYARPAKLFTANHSLLVSEVGKLTEDSLKQVIDAVIELLREGLKT
jgi:mRNA interferase MazF